MGSINKSHNEADGGILLFNGELILLYCDSVQCEIGGKESVKGRVYLTTHRMVMIVTPYRQNSAVKSLCAPFCAITKCNVEQPIFGANYIEATVRDESDGQRSFSFKLRFSKGGAIEFAMAMNRAVSMVGRNFNPNTPPPPAYTPSPSADYYQAPPTVYAPGYNCGVQMPVQQFPDQPPIGFIYASSAPPPYPGLGGNTGPGPAKPPPPYSQQPGGAYPQAGGQAGGYPGAQQGYPQQAPYSNPGQQQPGGHQQQPPVGFAAPGFQAPGSGYGQQPTGYPQQQAPVGYPQQSTGYPQQQPPTGYPQQQPTTGYPQQQPPTAGYPQQQPPSSGYPAASAYPQQPAGGQPPQQPPSTGYPQQQPASGYPGTAPPAQTSSAYPDLSQAGNPAGQPASDPATAAWPSAPSFNPNWQDEKKP